MNVQHSLVLRTDGVSPASLGDDFNGGYFAVRHLIDLGHRDIAVITGPEFTSSANDRVAGARKAMDEVGLALPQRRVMFTSYGIDGGIAAGNHLLNSNPPTAIFAANDNLAIGIMTIADQVGLRIGNDLSIVGYNDIPLAENLPVPLTTVRVPFDQIAEAALDLLFGDGPAETMKTMPVLIPRSSTSRYLD